ncbi:MAG: GIY-YIG nuclease family protein [Dichotomicrobium sp.]
MTPVQQDRQAAAYILANRRHGTLYTGVSSDLVQRIHQHKTGITKGFAWRYGCDRLVHFELFDSIADAIAREKQIKSGSRAKKTALIEAHNPDWADLYPQIIE